MRGLNREQSASKRWWPSWSKGAVIERRVAPRSGTAGVGCPKRIEVRNSLFEEGKIRGMDVGYRLYHPNLPLAIDSISFGGCRENCGLGRYG